MKNILAVSVLFSFGLACGGHIAEYQPKRRKYTPPVARPPVQVDTTTKGSLMAGIGLGATLFTDVRSFGIGDLITVRVMEASAAERSTSTQLERDSEFQSGFDLAGGLANIAKHNPTIDPTKLLYQNTRNRHRGGGTTRRKDKITFLVTAAVRQVLANGDLFIEGDRIVKVNDEEHHFYVSGVARPADVGPNNSISSTLLGEAEIEFFGEGVLSRKANQGWFGAALDWIWPF
jgi:flagellar L-ring protein precursor FlgH